MKNSNIDRMLLGVSIVGYLAMSASFMLMPVEALGIVPGIVFWAGLLIGTGMQMLLEKRRRAFFAAYGIGREKVQKPRNGLLTFASNKAAMIADGAFVCSMIAAILAFVLTKGAGYICYVCITAAASSFCLHCIFNGRIYFHINNQSKVRQALEQMKASKGEGNCENC